jgi:hypothetical protein
LQSRGVATCSRRNRYGFGHHPDRLAGNEYKAADDQYDQQEAAPDQPDLRWAEYWLHFFAPLKGFDSLVEWRLSIATLVLAALHHCLSATIVTDLFCSSCLSLELSPLACIFLHFSGARPFTPPFPKLPLCNNTALLYIFNNTFCILLKKNRPGTVR